MRTPKKGVVFRRHPLRVSGVDRTGVRRRTHPLLNFPGARELACGLTSLFTGSSRKGVRVHGHPLTRGTPIALAPQIQSYPPPATGHPWRVDVGVRLRRKRIAFQTRPSRGYPRVLKLERSPKELSRNSALFRANTEKVQIPSLQPTVSDLLGVGE